MAVSADYEAWVVDQLAGFGEVTARHMFGGAGLYHQGVMFGLIPGSAQTVYLKVSEATRPDYEAFGASPFQPYGSAMSYYEVPGEILEDPERLAGWARTAFAAARAAKAGKAATRRRRPVRQEPPAGGWARTGLGRRSDR